MAELCDAVSVIHEAFERTDDLPRAEVPEGVVNPLGMEPLDWFVFNVLSSAGITLEIINQHEVPVEVSKYQVVQIVEETSLLAALDNNDLNQVRWAKGTNMLGMQVKLNGVLHWKVNIVDQNLEHHNTSGRTLRGRGQSAVKTTQIQNLHMFEIAINVPSEGMRCTVAVARNITINIAFKTNVSPSASTSLWSNSLPLIAQRRIDFLFTNRYITSVQVRTRSICVPCAFQNANRTEHVERIRIV